MVIVDTMGAFVPRVTRLQTCNRDIFHVYTTITTFQSTVDGELAPSLAHSQPRPVNFKPLFLTSPLSTVPGRHRWCTSLVRPAQRVHVLRFHRILGLRYSCTCRVKISCNTALRFSPFIGTDSRCSLHVRRGAFLICKPANGYHQQQSETHP